MLLNFFFKLEFQNENMKLRFGICVRNETISFIVHKR